MTMAVGLIVHAAQAERILQEGRADLVALAREMLYNPNRAMDAAQKLGLDPQFTMLPPPYQYWLERRAATVPRRCAHRLSRQRSAIPQADCPQPGRSAPGPLPQAKPGDCLGLLRIIHDKTCLWRGCHVSGSDQ